MAGRGPVVLLAHGTGAATHSWRDLLPLLAEHFSVVAPDLPGHGFTDTPGGDGLSLPGMARLLTALLRALDLKPELAVGHSAGAAVLARMVLDGGIAPGALVGLNAAIVPLAGASAPLFAPLAKMVARVPFLPNVFAWRAASDPRIVERLLRGTGSRIEPAGVALYRRVIQSPAHAAAALAMMASWDLAALQRDLPKLRLPVLLVVGRDDRTIPPADALRFKKLVPQTEIVTLPGLGHLAHEERPAEVAALIARPLPVAA